MKDKTDWGSFEGMAVMALIAALLLLAFTVGTSVANGSPVNPDARVTPTPLPDIHVQLEQGQRLWVLCAGSGGQYGQTVIKPHGDDSTEMLCEPGNGE